MSQTANILVLHSDQAFREQLLGLLGALGQNALLADSKESALQLYHQHEPAILFADVKMPTSNGVSTNRRISCSDDQHVLTAIISGRSPQSLVEESMRAGACEYLDDSPTQDALRQMLERFAVLKGKREHRSYKSGTLRTAQLELELESRVNAVGPTVKMVLELLKGFVSPQSRMRLEIALDEAVRNALEHGNFAISNSEKEQLLFDDAFDAELKRREQLPENQTKHIRVKAEYSSSEFSCTISDDGQGFDWRKVPDPTTDPIAITNLNGRGLLLMRQIFDSVHYNEKGNQVRLVKKLPF